VRALADRAGMYVFVSSGNVHADHSTIGADEPSSPHWQSTSKRLTCPLELAAKGCVLLAGDPAIERGGRLKES